MDVVDDKTKYVWRMWGKWFGYPDCCVEALCKGEQKHGGYFTGTGFVPCEKCYDKPVEDLVSQIHINRWSGDELLDWSASNLNEEGLTFIKNFWKCMRESYDRNSN